MDAASASQQRVTELLQRWSNGDGAALAELTPLVYDELRRVAHHHLGGQQQNAMNGRSGLGTQAVEHKWH
jgi:ECF sigma factor